MALRSTLLAQPLQKVHAKYPIVKISENVSKGV
jgi:hypothetical protein